MTSFSLPAVGLSLRASIVSDEIRDSILRGDYPPGSELVERQLAEHFKISKTPVREALIRLARSGIVTIEPNRGARVRELDQEAIDSVFEIRLLLEPYAVEKGTEHITRSDIRRAHQVIDNSREALDQGNYAELSLNNREFHRILYRASGNILIISALDDVQDQLALHAVSLLWQREGADVEREHNIHIDIMHAVEQKDGDKAKCILHNHIMESWNKSS